MKESNKMKRIYWETEDPSTPALVEPMLDDIQNYPDKRVWKAAKRYALERIKEEVELYASSPEMGELQSNTIIFIAGYKQALEDTGQKQS